MKVNKIIFYFEAFNLFNYLSHWCL